MALPPCEPNYLQLLASAGAGGVLTYSAALFFRSSADRDKSKQDRYKNSEDLLKHHDEFYTEYTHAINAYCNSTDANNLSHFQKISVTGDRYLSGLNRMAAAYLSENLEPGYSTEAIVPKVLDNYRLIEDHYSTLHELGKKIGLEFPKEFERANYAAVFSVVEKYGPSRKNAPPAVDSIG